MQHVTTHYHNYIIQFIVCAKTRSTKTRHTNCIRLKERPDVCSQGSGEYKKIPGQFRATRVLYLLTTIGKTSCHRIPFYGKLKRALPVEPLWLLSEIYRDYVSIALSVWCLCVQFGVYFVMCSDCVYISVSVSTRDCLS